MTIDLEKGELIGYLRGLLANEKINLDDKESRVVLMKNMRELTLKGNHFAKYVLDAIIVHQDKPYIANMLQELIDKL